MEFATVGSVMNGHDWGLTSLIVVLAVSLFANCVGVVWSIYRELCIRHMSDTLMKIVDAASKTLTEIQAGLVGLCKRIEEDGAIRRDAKREISNDIEGTGKHITDMLQMLMQMIRGNTVNVNGSAQFNERDGSQNG